MADTVTNDGPEAAATPGPLWDNWSLPPRVPGVPELHLAGFDGPMDLLLDLAERQRIDLGQISILQLIEQFIAEMARLQRHVALDRRADWLIMATRLLLLRSRLLFPASPDAEAKAAQDAGREAKRLAEMALVRTAAAWLDRRFQLGRDVFARLHGRNPRLTSYMALMEACLTVLQGRDGQPGQEAAVYRLAPTTLFRVDEAMARIRKLIAERQGGGIEFVHCLPTIRSDDPRRELKARSAVASSLIALLELARNGEVTAAQAEREAPILLTRQPARNASQ